MKKTVRIIPRLDIKGPNLVKGVQLEGLRVLGQPNEFAEYYFKSGADEIFFQDVVASLLERNSLHEIISRTAKNIFIPITVGGGIKNLDDIYKVLRAGADKVSLNTAAIKNPNFISEAVRNFGSSTIVIAIEAIKNKNGVYFSFVDNGREETGVEVKDWARRIDDLGAGEIIITSVDQDGTGNGFDKKLVSLVKKNVSIPVIAHGGGNKTSNLLDTINLSSADAVAFASLFHYEAFRKIDQKFDESEKGNRYFVEKKEQYSRINPTTIKDLKHFLIQNNISCRL